MLSTTELQFVYNLLFFFKRRLLSYLMSSSFFSSTKVGGTVDTTTCMSRALTTETWEIEQNTAGGKRTCKVLKGKKRVTGNQDKLWLSQLFMCPTVSLLNSFKWSSQCSKSDLLIACFYWCHAADLTGYNSEATAKCICTRLCAPKQKLPCGSCKIRFPLEN